MRRPTRQLELRAVFGAAPLVVNLPRDVGARFVAGYSYSPATKFVRGQRTSPATEIKRGEHRSKRTEFVKGQAAHNKLAVGTVTIRMEQATGNPRAWVKIAEPNKWRQRAVVVWESVNGPLPRGHLIHHVDHGTLNDAIENLVCITRREHSREHRAELSSGLRRAIAANDGRRLGRT